MSLDPKWLAKLDTVHPSLRTKVIALVNMAAVEGFTLQVTQALRTFAEQDALFNQPHDHKDNDGDHRIDEADEHVTNCRGGQSWHNYGLAVDFIFVVDGKRTYVPDSLYSNIGRWARTAGLEWGGSWKHTVDRPHVQLPHLPDKPSQSLIALLRTEGVESIWKHFP
jgi:peptidoglycan L-alanyl-D-glutamate endopeptidase CwlK